MSESQKDEWFLRDKQTEKEIAWNEKGDILLPGKMTSDEAFQWVVDQVKAENAYFDSENVELKNRNPDG